MLLVHTDYSVTGKLTVDYMSATNMTRLTFKAALTNAIDKKEDF